MKLCLISDTHNQHYKLDIPECDVLVHAGDFTMNGGEAAIRSFNTWLRELRESGRIGTAVVIAGNHDLHFHFRSKWAEDMLTDCVYLRDSWADINGVRFYGSPWTPTFGQGWAFNAEPLIMHNILQVVPKNVDVLITHGPPKGMFDFSLFGGVHVGSKELADKIAEVKPKLNVFGHIHESYGHASKNGVEYYNASVVNSKYQVTNKPWIVDI